MKYKTEDQVQIVKKRYVNDCEIHITTKKREVHAILKENGTVVKHTVAKCSPEDVFDFHTGVEIALFRLKHGIEN